MSKRIVEWKKPCMHNVAGLFILKPGVNEVEASKVEAALKNPVIKWYVEQGLIVLGDGPAPETLEKLKPAEAVALVKKTVDKELLERWFDAEKRKPVLEAIEAQIDAITPKQPQKSQTATGDGPAPE